MNANLICHFVPRNFDKSNFQFNTTPIRICERSEAISTFDKDHDSNLYRKS
jgi:hypothetical protein